jgi:hypothetical protein
MIHRRTSARNLVLLGLVAGTAAAGLAAGRLPPRQPVTTTVVNQGGDGWDEGFFLPGLDGPASAVLPAASGGAWVGGAFTAAGDASARGVAWWDGGRWLAVGGSVDGEVRALVADGSGGFYAGGTFSEAGGTAAANVAHWNGSTWSALGSGTTGTVEALARDAAGNLYAGGTFAQAGGVTVSNIARWTGSAWQVLGSGTDGAVHALATSASGNLFAGGAFTTAGGVTARRIARWDGSAWRALSSGLGDEVLALQSAGSLLYVGGRFVSAGGNPRASYLAQWNGSAWAPVVSGYGTTGITSAVHALALDGSNRLYVAGAFSMGGGGGRRSVTRWNGSSWLTLGDGMNGTVRCLALDGAGQVLAGGDFAVADYAAVNHVAVWDGAEWLGMADGGAGLGDTLDPASPSVAVSALVVDASNSVFVAGTFTTAGAVLASRVARWDGSTWSAVAGTTDPSARLDALAADDAGNVYLGGTFTSIGGVSAANVARWDGYDWNPLGSGTDGHVASLAVDASGDLYAAGPFNTAGGIVVNNVARWNGTSWQALGTGWPGAAAVAVAGGSTYACCSLTVGPNGMGYSVGRYAGYGSWTLVGQPFDIAPSDLAFGPGSTLHAAGDFTQVGGQSANRIARWDGAAWVAFGDGLDGGVRSVAFDSLGRLYAGGVFAAAGGSSASRIARWDGSSWQALGSGTDRDVVALATDLDGKVYAGGAFTSADGIRSARVARFAPGLPVTATPTSSPSPTASASPSATASRTPTSSPTPSRTPTFTPTGSPSATPSSTASPTRSATPGPTATSTATDTATPSATASATAGATLSPTAGPTSTSTRTPTSTPQPSDTATPTPTDTPAPSATPTASDTPTPSPSPSPSATPTPSATPVVSLTPSLTPTVTPSPTRTPTVTPSATRTSTVTLTPSATPTPTVTPSATSSPTPTRTATPTPSPTPTSTPTPTATAYPDGNGRWDEKIGAVGIAGTVRAVVADGRGRVYVGGDITSAGGVPVSNVAWWDGERWRDPAGGLNAPVVALAADPRGNVYAAGEFSFAGGLPVRNLAMWDGFAWSPVGGGVGDAVQALAMDAQGVLYVGGLFSTVGDGDANHVARWNGQAWSPLGEGVDDEVLAIATDREGRVAVVGSHTTSSGVEYRVWRWAGGVWTKLYTTGIEINAVAAGHDGRVYIGGKVSGGVLVWDGATWAAAGRGLNNAVAALTVDADGYVYAVGSFTTSGTTTVNRVARWNGNTWSALGSGLGGSAGCIATDARGVYVGGLFPTAGGKTSVRVGWYHGAPATGPLTPPPTDEPPCRNLTVARGTGGTVRVLTARDCASGFLDGTVVRLRAEPDSGYRWQRWRGDAAGPSVIANVVMTADRSVAAEFNDQPVRRTAVVLLHGWQGYPGARARACPAGRRAVRVDSATVDSRILPDDDIEAFGRHLLADRQEVWAAAYTTGPDATAPIPDSATCLRDQLLDLRASGVEDVSIIAHDMGGLVARAYLESDAYLADRATSAVVRVLRLVTVGTPHAGSAAALLGCALGEGGRDHPGLCVLPYGDLETLNGRTFSRRPPHAAYDFVAGLRATPLVFRLPFQSITDVHDGVVAAESALGRTGDRVWSEPWRTAPRVVVGANNGTGVGRLAVSASHFSPPAWRDPARQGYPTYFNAAGRTDTAATATYACLRQLLELADEGCDPAPSGPVTLGRPQAVTSAVSPVLLESGTFLPGQAVEHRVVVDGTGPGEVALNWVTGTLRVALTDPEGRTIGPSYAATSGDVDYVGPQTHADARLAAAYVFTRTVTGVYTATISGADVPSGGTRYAVSAFATSPRALVLATDRRLYRAGTTAVVTAALTSGTSALSGADVSVTLTVPGGPDVTVPALAARPGVYVGSVPVPTTGGRFPVRVVASGTDGGVAFRRLALAAIYVDAEQIRLTGTHAATARDDDGDGLADRLDFAVGMTVGRPGTYLVAADIVDATGALVAHTAGIRTLATGGVTTTLVFDGDAIRDSGKDSRYRLANLTVTATEDGLDPVFEDGLGPWSALAYTARSFGATCFALDLVVEPAGAGRIAPLPAADCNTGLQYGEGDRVDLEAVENAGYSFLEWAGDLGGSDATRTITMDRDFRVIARFEVMATPTPTPSPTTTPEVPVSPTPTPTPTDGPSPTATAPVTPSTTPTHTPEPTTTSLPDATTPIPTPDRPRPVFLPLVSR